MNSLLHSIKKELKEVKQEIGNYPSPITGCDVQFNDLLKRRSELEKKIREMKTNLRSQCGKEEIYIEQGNYFKGSNLKDFPRTLIVTKPVPRFPRSFPVPLRVHPPNG